MKDWWQKISIDWPCALGDFLWAMLVIEPARVLDRIRRRHILHFIGILFLLVFFRYVVAMDLTFLFGVDLGLLMEVAAAAVVLIARKQSSATVTVVRHHLVRAKPRIMQVWRRGARRVRHAIQTLKLPANDDEPAAALA